VRRVASAVARLAVLEEERRAAMLRLRRKREKQKSEGDGAKGQEEVDHEHSAFRQLQSEGTISGTEVTGELSEQLEGNTTSKSHFPPRRLFHLFRSRSSSSARTLPRVLGLQKNGREGQLLL
jgi:hypothetical protein